MYIDLDLVVSRFGPELWFEPEPPRTGPKFGPKFGENVRTELTVPFAVRPASGWFEPVRTNGKLWLDNRHFDEKSGCGGTCGPVRGST